MSIYMLTIDEKYKYIGSTKTNIRARLSRHLCKARMLLDQHKNNLLFNKINSADKISITLLESVENGSKMEVREQFFIDAIKPELNQRKAYTGLSRAEYRKKYAREYHSKNRERIAKQRKEYYNKNIKGNPISKLICKCGTVVQKNNLSRHKKSKTHEIRLTSRFDRLFPIHEEIKIYPSKYIHIHESLAR